MAKALLLHMHAPSSTVRSGEDPIEVRESVDLASLERELEAEYPAVFKGPSFSSNLQFYVTGNGEFRDFPKRGQEGTDKPIRHRDLSRVLSAMVNAGCDDLERYAMICWVSLKLPDIRQNLSHQIKMNAPLPDLDGEGRMYEDLVALGDWLHSLNMRGLHFKFEIATGGSVMIDLIQPAVKHPEICSRMRALLPAILDDASLPMRDGMSGEFRLPEKGFEVHLVALNPDTGWEHSRTSGPSPKDTYDGFTPRKHLFEDETTPVRVEVLQSMLGDTYHKIRVEQSYKNGAWIGRPNITLGPEKVGYRTPELAPGQEEAILAKLGEFLPEFMDFSIYRLQPTENEIADLSIDLENDVFDITLDFGQDEIDLSILSSDNRYTYDLPYERRLLDHFLERSEGGPSQDDGPEL